MTLEPMYLLVIATVTVLSSIWIVVACVRRSLQMFGWKLVALVTGWTLFVQESTGTKLLTFFRSDAANDFKLMSVVGAVLIVLNTIFVLKFLLRKGRTSWGDRLILFLVFGTTQGLITFWVHSAAGFVCMPFSVWKQLCTSYKDLGMMFLPVPTIAYWLMTVVTNEENTYSVLSTFGHRVGVSKEGVDFDPEPSTIFAMVFQSLGLKTFFNRVRHFTKKSYNVQAEAVQAASDGIQMLVYLGAGFEIADALKFDEVGEEFALATAKQDLTGLVANTSKAKRSEQVLDLHLTFGFVDNFNHKTKPAERYGLRMTTATPWRAEYYDKATQAFFNELATLSARGVHLEKFTQEAKRVYDALSKDMRRRFTFEEYIAMWMALAGKGSTFGHFGFHSR